MLLYILKSAACLAILLAFYKIFLERENMHTFKRFYLLGALFAAFIIPFVTFVEFIEIPEVIPITEPSTTHLSYVTSIVQEEVTTDYIAAILWSIYGIGIVVFGFKFLKNLSRIIQRIRKNPKLRINRITNVLIREYIAPHTFFSYIFLNKAKFESHQIPKEVLLHEETHARQKHSLDVLFIEFLQVLFWFNPFIYLTKKSIKLNHEFLADREVVRKGINPSKYQNILLKFSSNSVQPQLANAINYSSTRLILFGKTFTFGRSAVGQVKKRFAVMKKRTSKNGIIIRSLLLLPLLAILLYSFCQKKIVETYPESTQTIIGTWIDDEMESIELSFFEQDGDLMFDGENSIPIRVQIINGECYRYISPKYGLKPSDRRLKLPVIFDREKGTLTYSKRKYIPIEKGIKRKLYGNWENKKEGVKFNVLHSGNEIVWDVIKADGKPVRYYPKKINDRYAFTYGKELELWSFKVENDVLYDSKGIEYYRITKDTKQKGATKNQIAEFNALAKKYNAQPKESRVIPLKDLKILEDVYGLMTQAQKNRAEAFPECPIQEGATKLQIQEYNALAKKYYELPRNAGISSKEIDRINYIYGLMTEKQKADAEPFPFPDLSKEQKFQEDATKAQIIEYNALASKYNKMSKDDFRVIGKDVRKLEYIYSMMSAKQRKNSEPFPNFPPPPPPPTAPNSVKENSSPNSPKAPRAPRVKKGEKSDIPPPPSASNLSDLEIADKVIDEIIAHQDPYDINPMAPKILKGEMGTIPPTSPAAFNTIREVSELNNYIKGEKDTFLVEPLAPPPPKSPLEHVKEMAKKDAIFYYEGKEISSDKAIMLLKKNKKINLRTRHEGLKQPIVELSTKPILIKK